MSEETSNEMDTTPGIVSWNELMTRDAAASAKFYTALFGWTREDLDTGAAGYSVFKAGDRPVGGMIVLPTDADGMLCDHLRSPGSHHRPLAIFELSPGASEDTFPLGVRKTASPPQENEERDPPFFHVHPRFQVAFVLGNSSWILQGMQTMLPAVNDFGGDPTCAV